MHLHIKQSNSPMPGLRKVLEEFEQKVPSNLDALNAEEHKRVTESLRISSKERKKRLDAAPKKPEKEIIRVVRFKRNPDVVAEVLERAKGICEVCNNPAPFIRKSDDKPYLEVHHKIRLADGGEDSVENAIALCPNCHRNEHYGK
ncbi:MULTISPECIES: HNH endonuclease [Eikenella]|uniref:HNH endonuclease n=1 Tax=Eikenella TaxID=538 RepID=UPI000B19126A|nr:MULTISPECIES: HNH endonuclease [Eikenella]